MRDRECFTATLDRERTTNVFCVAPSLTGRRRRASPTHRAHAVGGGSTHRRHLARKAGIQPNLDRYSREVLDVLQVDATTEYDSEAAMPLLIPPGAQYGATRSKAGKGNRLGMGQLQTPATHELSLVMRL
jgi:hypothetical protein